MSHLVQESINTNTASHLWVAIAAAQGRYRICLGDRALNGCDKSFVARRSPLLRLPLDELAAR
jgi:hypothetical protein